MNGKNGMIRDINEKKEGKKGGTKEKKKIKREVRICKRRNEKRY